MSLNVLGQFHNHLLDSITKGRVFVIALEVFANAIRPKFSAAQ
jgi:hypothetical protein